MLSKGSGWNKLATERTHVVLNSRQVDRVERLTLYSSGIATLFEALLLRPSVGGKCTGL